MDSRPRLTPHRTTAINFRVLVFALVVMGFLQVASSVAILLHLTGYLHQVDLSTTEQQNTPEVTQQEPISADTLKDPQQVKPPRVPKRRKETTPAAHLPIKPPSGHMQRDVHATMILWNSDQGHLSRLGYRDGRILVHHSGLYYVYAKTCFRYYDNLESDAGSERGPGRAAVAFPDDGGAAQLIQYVYRERRGHGAPLREVMVMKSGVTHRWRRGAYHMCCQQQGAVLALRRGDGLYVSVSNSWMLDPEAEGSYFGAFRISR